MGLTPPRLIPLGQLGFAASSASVANALKAQAAAEAARDDAETTARTVRNISGIAVPDDVVKALVQDPESETAIAVTAQIAEQVADEAARADSTFQPAGDYASTDTVGAFVMANAPEIAANAADLAQSDAGLVHKADPGIPAEVAPGDFAEVVTDSSGYVASGTKLDGTSYFARMETPQINGVPADKTVSLVTDYSVATVDANGVISEVGTADVDGKVPAWILRNWTRRQTQALLGVACYGDSMTFGYQGGGTSYPGVMSALVPVPIENYGVTGQTSTEVALRNGGLDVFVTVTGGSIPASGPVAVTVLPGGVWRSGFAWSFPGSLAGVAGTLAKDTSGNWTFTRTANGSLVACPPETRWQSGQASTPLVGQIVWMGRNNTTDLDTALRDYKAVITGARRLGPVLALPIFNMRTETAGSANYNTIMTFNAELADFSSSDFYDHRGWLIRNGLAEMGLTPTAQDSADIANDCIPQSLMYSDNEHLNASGYTAIGRQLARVTTDKGWYAQ